MKQIVPGAAPTQDLRGVSPGAASTSKRFEAGAFREVAGAAMGVTNLAKSIREDQKTADMSIEYSQDVQDAISEQYITTSRALELGAKDGPHLWSEDDTGAIERNDININEILPEIAKSRYDKLTDKHGADIIGYGSRQEWINRRRAAGEDMYAQMSADRDAGEWGRVVEKYNFAIEEAKRTGDYALASSMIDAHPAPDTINKEKEILNVGRMSEVETLHEVLNTGTVEDLDSLIQVYTNKESTDSFHSKKEQSSFIALLKARKSQLAGSSSYLPVANEMHATYAQQMATEDYNGALSTLFGMKTYVENQGEPEYFGRQYFGNQMGELTEQIVIQQKKEANWQRFAEGSVRSMDSLGSQEKGWLEDNVTETMRAAVATGDPETIKSTVAGLVQLSSDANWVPQEFKGTMNSLNSPGIGQAELIAGASVYGQYAASGNQQLLGTLDDFTIGKASMLFNRQMGGQDLVSANADIQAAYGDKLPETIKRLQLDFTAQFEGERAINEAVFESKFEQGRWSWIETMPVPDPNMKTLFNAMTKMNYVSNGGDISSAQDTAWIRLTNAYQPTMVNGREEWVRGAPEAKFNVSTDAVRAELNAYILNTTNLTKSEAQDLTMRPAIGTGMADRPYYTLWKPDKYGLSQQPLIRQDTGQQMVWVPDGNTLQARDEIMKQEAVTKDPTKGNIRRRQETKLVGRRNVVKRKAKVDASRLRVINERSKEMAETRRRQKLANDMGLNNE